MDASQFVHMNRHGLSRPPDPGDDLYEEQLTNWILELAFFRDFVYRNPSGKGGKGELADGVVLFDKTAIFVQCKSQRGTKDPVAWSKSAIREAARQLGYGARMLRQRLIPSLASATLGPVPFDPTCYPEQIGLIVLDPQPSDSFEEIILEPFIKDVGLPVHVLSLHDLIAVLCRFDTASDALFYFRERHYLREHHGLIPSVHRESEVLHAMSQLIPSRLLQNRPHGHPCALLRSTCAFRRRASGRLRNSPAWIRSLLIDDIIAHLHEQDPGLYSFPQASRLEVMRIAEVLSRLDRSRRAWLGAQLIRAIKAAADGTPRSFWRGLRATGVCYVFLVCDYPREERVNLLRWYVARAMFESGMERGLGVATNSRNVVGRAYDVLSHDGPLSQSECDAIQDLPSPFGI